jgi:hypothetical protein
MFEFSRADPDDDSETYGCGDWKWIGSEGFVTEVNDESGQDTKPETGRTVTVTGIPLLIAGVVAALSFRWIRRRFRRPGDSAS